MGDGLDDLKRAMRKVADWYRCSAEECRLMWECAVRDLDNAKRCFYALAEEIDAQHSISVDRMVLQPEQQDADQ